jgi:hypothetical protein
VTQRAACSDKAVTGFAVHRLAGLAESVFSHG